MRGLPQHGAQAEETVRFVLQLRQSTAARLREIAAGLNVSPSDLGGIILDIAIREYDFDLMRRNEEKKARAKRAQ